MRVLLASTLLAAGLVSVAATPAQAADCAFADNLVRTEPWFKKHKPELNERQRKAAIVLMEAFASNAMRCLVNAERKKEGVAPLADSYRLYKAADEHVKAAKMLKWWIDRPEDPNNTQWHINPVTKSDVGVRARAAGYCPTGSWRVQENVFADWDDRATPRAAMRWWMNSAGHRAAILNPEMTHTGISVRYGKARPGLNTDVAMVTTEVFGYCR